jgi:hypothetical protein
MLTKNVKLPFLSLHTLAAARGDGLRPEFVKLFTRLAVGADATLSESAQPPAGLKSRLRTSGASPLGVKKQLCQRPI